MCKIDGNSQHSYLFLAKSQTHTSMSYELILKVRQLPFDEQKQAYYQHDVGKLLAEHVVEKELLYISIGYYKDSRKVSPFLCLSFGREDHLRTAEARIKGSHLSFHWMKASASETAHSKESIQWKLLCCFPDGAPAILKL